MVIFNKSTVRAKTNCWKMSRTIFLFIKEIKKTTISNFRPIGLFNGFSKILETILHKRMLSFLNNNNFFKTNQFVCFFLPGPNVMQAITKHLNYIFSALNSNESVLLVMLDISKAYDCINYKILLKKFENTGIRGNALHCIDLNLTYKAGGKSWYKWYLLRLLWNIRD